MFPFPATLDGKPVRVYSLTGDHALIAHANGKAGKVQWSSLRLPTEELRELRAGNARGER